VVLVVSQPVSTVLEGWQTRTLRSAALGGGFVLAIGGLTLLGLHGARQERALTAALWAERGALERRVAERTAALAESEARFREAADTAPMMVGVGDSSGACVDRSRSWHDFTGQAPDAALGTGWLAMVHPADRDGVAATVAAAQCAASPFRLEYRLHRADGTWRRVLDVAALRRGRNGCFLGHVGSVLDITERHEAAERQAMMARELDHRAKNALAVVQAALRLTPKRDALSYAQAVEGRVAALARAHGALAQCRWQGVSLRDVVEGELAAALPARDQPAAARPVRIAGPVVALAPGSVQAIAMALHELATNATRFGSLSRPDGGVEVTWHLDGAEGMLELRWLERGGPSVAGPPLRLPCDRGHGGAARRAGGAALGGARPGLPHRASLAPRALLRGDAARTGQGGDGARRLMYRRYSPAIRWSAALRSRVPARRRVPDQIVGRFRPRIASSARTVSASAWMRIACRPQRPPGYAQRVATLPVQANWRRGRSPAPGARDRSRMSR
jgi:PAS domain S-box-containing protein